MVARLAPLAQQRALLQQVSDLQADKIGNEVRRPLVAETGKAEILNSIGPYQTKEPRSGCQTTWRTHLLSCSLIAQQLGPKGMVHCHCSIHDTSKGVLLCPGGAAAGAGQPRGTPAGRGCRLPAAVLPGAVQPLPIACGQ